MSETENTSNIDPKIEKDARQFGWVPLEEFRGGEDKWVDAETFVQRGKEINPILKKNNERLLKQLEDTNKKLEEVSKSADDFRTFQKEQMEKRVKEYDQRIAELKEAKKDAVSSGDGEKVVALDDAIDAVKEEKAAAKVPTTEKPEEKKGTVVIDPVLQAWIDKNDWYGADKRKTRIANDIAAELRSENPNLINQPFLDKLSEELLDSFPDMFGKPKKEGSPVEGSGSTRPGKASKHSYENLPADAKQACDRYVKTIKNYTREKYLADYVWD